ncbi:MAG: hypothetical protein QF921_08815 [Pseudomonadales bacterium]|nr:hypothetical protein [Pseudomonadales bacterium]MDP6828231.1 hypothetical protein [Pseudomonadales bacterium]MDP6971595.1 hypothetical protein [Pseudomonadales bacterium]
MTYAIARHVASTAVMASATLLNELGGLSLAPGTQRQLHCRRLGHMHACWSLPVVVG